MYDEIIKNVKLTSDEIDILTELLSHYLDGCLSVGEEITIKNLIEKLSI